jgi:hypothetical protein
VIGDSDYYLIKVCNFGDILSQRGFNVACAAAITGYARMHMSKAIVHNDVFYTDTDSIFIANELNATEFPVDSTRLGAFKYEGFVNEAYFVEPKLYGLLTDKGIVMKGAKHLNYDDLKLLYTDKRLPSVAVTQSFIKDKLQLLIRSRTVTYNKAHVYNKRVMLYDSNNRWIGTKPMNLTESMMRIPLTYYKSIILRGVYKWWSRFVSNIR